MKTLIRTSPGSSARRHRWGHALATVALVLAASSTGTTQAGGAIPTPAPDCGTAGASNTYAGRAYSLGLDSTVAGIDVDLGPVPDTGELPSTGGTPPAATLATIQGVDLGIPLPLGVGLNASVLHNTVMGSGDTSTAFSSVVGLSLGLNNGLTSLLTVDAAVLNAQATVKCVNRTRTVDAANTNSQIVGLAIKVLGVPVSIPVNAPANTRLALPKELALLAKGSITLNEQLTVGGRQVVNALHVKLDLLSVLGLRIASVDLVVSHAEANLTCGAGSDPDSCNCSTRDFVTGGGQIPVDGGRAAFSVNGKAEGSNGPKGHLNLVNNQIRQHLKSNDQTGYAATGATARRLTFTCADNLGYAGTCTVDVEDNSTSGGGGDKFGVLPGYALRAMSNGNLVLHQPNCGTGYVPPTTDGGSGGGSTPTKGGGKKK